MKKALKIVLTVIIVCLAIFLAYCAYVLIDYHRLDDNLALETESPVASADADTDAVKTGTTYKIITHNVGFGAYTPDYSFFMDGGTESWAFSKDAVIENITNAADFAKSYDPDFLMVQELDIDGTRSYHVNELELYENEIPSYYYTFAQNYDSPFLMWPLTQPHGANKAGLALFSKYKVESAVRRSFPISDSFSKLVDLDRCYSVNRIPTENGHYLCLYVVHMSAYGSSEDISAAQISMLCEDMEEEYAAGNYVICGGDFNHDLRLADDASYVATWAQPFPRSSLPEGFTFALDQLTEEEKDALEDSCRDAGAPYVAGETETYMLDGFILSDNITMKDYTVLATGYSYADHDPVYMEFELN